MKKQEDKIRATKKEILLTFVVMVSSLLLVVDWSDIIAFADSIGGEDQQAWPIHYITVKEITPSEIISDPIITFTPNDSVPLSKDLQEYTYNLCELYNVSYESVIAVIDVESDFNPDVVGITHDYGLMQISPIKLRELKDKLNITNILDPYQNISIGIYILSNLNAKYEGHEVYMAYNFGEAGMKRYTQKGNTYSDYSVKVMSEISKWSELLGGK